MSAHIYLENLQGVQDGSNQVFTVIFPITMLQRITVNGGSYPPDDTVYGYSQTGPFEITFATYAPMSDEVLLIYYLS